TRRLPIPIEGRTHIAVADRLRETCHPGWIWSHIASGEHRSPETGALLKRMGLRRGLFDFLLISPTGVHHWLELKRGHTRLSEHQEEFAIALRRCGVPHHVAHSYDDAVRQLKRWGAIA